MNVFSPLRVVDKRLAKAQTSKELAAFKQHKQTLLRLLLRHKFASACVETHWNALERCADHYFHAQLPPPLSPSERRKRLRNLADALRRASSLTERALKDDLGDDLYRAWCAKHGLSSHLTAGLDAEGSILFLRAEQIKHMASELATLKEVADKAAMVELRVKSGRPAILPRDLLQGLARVYRQATGLRPGRGDGPFADFAHAFAVAVGQKLFSHRGLVDAIQDAHRSRKPSWFDGKPPNN
jgi:hypothetical protein